MSNRNEAFIDFKEGLTYKEIAIKNNVSESAVKSWASRFWNNDKDAVLQRKKNRARLPQKKRPSLRHNKNSEKHGGYSIVDINNLSKDESLMFENYPRDLDTADLVKEEIALSVIRLNRLLKSVKKLQEGCNSGNQNAVQTTINSINGNEMITDCFTNPFLAAADIEHEITVFQNHLTCLLKFLDRINRREKTDQWLIDFIDQINSSDSKE